MRLSHFLIKLSLIPALVAAPLFAILALGAPPAFADGKVFLSVAVDGDVHAPVQGREPGRDDVRLRHEQLTRMGWVPVPVRSTDVFTDPAREVARVLAALRERGPTRR